MADLNIKPIILMFEVHQPYRLQKNFSKLLIDLKVRKRDITFEDLKEIYFDNYLNKFVIRKAAERAYLPANRIILEKIEEYRYENRKFKVTYSLSGVFIEQCEKWAPEVIESFKQLADTGMVEFLDQTFYHSLASIFSEEEFETQIRDHQEKMRELFGIEPVNVENTEFIYNNRIAFIFEKMGYEAVFTEGVERILGWRSPNYLYKAKGLNLRVLMRNYRLSDDIGFRFNARWWSEYPLTADKYAVWLAYTPGQLINICMDYETFGEHFPRETGIFEFLKWLPDEILKWKHLCFMTPAEVVEKLDPVDEIDVPEHMTISWADIERDLTAWLMNSMQYDAFNRIKESEKIVKNLGDDNAVYIWRLLTVSDHLYYMNTKGGGPGDVHTYFSPYGSALEAYSVYMSIFSDFFSRLIDAFKNKKMRLKLAWIRDVPEHMIFQFYYGDDRPVGWIARNMENLLWCIAHVPIESIEYHLKNGHFSKWIREAIGDLELADEIIRIGSLTGEEARRRLMSILENRRKMVFTDEGE